MQRQQSLQLRHSLAAASALAAVTVTSAVLQCRGAQALSTLRHYSRLPRAVLSTAAAAATACSPLRV